MRLHFRRFHRKFDEALFEQRLVGHGVDLFGRHARRLAASFHNPVVVEGEEGEATLAELRQRVASGTLLPHDLVNDGSGWRLLEASPLFDEVLEPWRRQRRRRHVLRHLGLAILVVLTAWWAA